MKKFYITTTLPYVNSDPHLGFIKEIVNADVIARHHRQLAEEVFFNTGTDEHGQKVQEQAAKLKIEPIDYASSYAQKFLALKDSFNLSFNSFIRTTDDHHIKAAQEFWRLCYQGGDIYKKKYQGKYCVGCEMEKTDSELDHGVCPYHPKQKLETIEEENYFFRFSKYQSDLLKLYESQADFVRPQHRFNEIINFVRGGLKDFSVSRLKEKMSWGIPVPGDDSQVMYVWFDALANYISCLGWPEKKDVFQDFWPACQVCGKDNLRPQSAMWPAFLLSAGLKPPREILVFGFLTVNGKKISKSEGNVINFEELRTKYDSDPIRYYLVKGISTFSDGDFSYDKLNSIYTSDLANGLGNLVSRVSNLIEKTGLAVKFQAVNFLDGTPLIEDRSKWSREFLLAMSDYRLSEALEILIQKIRENDELLSRQAPWKMTDQDQIKAVLQTAGENILNIAVLIFPFIPETALKIIKQFQADQIVKADILFPRLNN